MVKCYSDFIQLINDEQFNDYHVVLRESSIIKEGWSRGNYINYLCGLELHKSETGITISYQSSVDASNRVSRIDVFIHFPEEKGVSERDYTMFWVVRYNNLENSDTSIQRVPEFSV